MARPGWISRLLPGPRKPGPPITSVEMIPARRASFDWTELNHDLPPLKEFHERVEIGSLNGRKLDAEIYVPNGKAPLGVLVYFHGGAWCTLSAQHVRKSAMAMTSADLVVVNFNYSLAPEFPFPCAVEDCIFAARWTAQNCHRYGASADRLILGGDSAGANLAAVATAFLNGDRSHPLNEGELSKVEVKIAGLLLLYGVFDFQRRLLEQSTTPGTTEIMGNLAYLGTHFLSFHKNPMVSPLRSTRLAQFPPTYLCCGSWDATLAQSLAMTQTLADLDVAVTLSIVPGMDHEFLLIADRDPLAGLEFRRVLAWLETIGSRN